MKRIIYSCAIAMLALLGARGAMAQGVSYNTTGAPAHASAMLDVQSTSKGVLVPRMTGAQKWAILSPATGLMIFQTDSASGFYYYTGSAWSAIGVTGNPLTIGASFGGGIVAYILQPGDPGYSALEQHGLIAATSDQSTGVEWGCNGTFGGATGFLLGNGRNNTEIIYQNCGTSGNASAVCKSYSGGGFTDWYLPSKYELNKLYINQVAIGNFAIAAYWSSSESNASLAWVQLFGSGDQYLFSKDLPPNVRAVRSF